MKNETEQDFAKSVLELRMTAGKIMESQLGMEKDIREIRDSLFDPDKGLYARVCRNTEFRTSASRWLWVLTTGVTLSILHVLFKYFVGT